MLVVFGVALASCSRVENFEERNAAFNTLIETGAIGTASQVVLSRLARMHGVGAVVVAAKMASPEECLKAGVRSEQMARTISEWTEGYWERPVLFVLNESESDIVLRVPLNALPADIGTVTVFVSRK